MFKSVKLWWIYRDCPCPEHRRWCLHSDVINTAKGFRAVCMDCGRKFKALPSRCSIASIREGKNIYHRSLR